MAGPTPNASTSNRILVGLSPEDFGLLQPHLEAIDLPLRRQLEIRNRRIDYVYFIDSGFASVVASGANNGSIEVGLIGREGMTGLALMMGVDRTPNETYMQLGGTGRRIRANIFVRAIGQSMSLHRAFLLFAHTLVIQTAHTAMANGRSKTEDRLARWLLMAHDRADRDDLPVTHDFLALMLGTQRPGVTIALNHLEKRGFIRAQRGIVTIVDRRALEKSSNGAYGGPEAELKRLFI